jgi:hypothetical protein
MPFLYLHIETCRISTFFYGNQEQRNKKTQKLSTVFLQTLDAYQKEDGMQQIHAEKILIILFIHMIFYILSC